MRDHFAPPTLTPAAGVGSKTDVLAGVRLLDVTLRDGGFETGFHWPLDILAIQPTLLGPLGVDIVELGYIGGVPLEHSVERPGVGAFLQPEHLRAARADGVQLAAMVHPTALDANPPLDLEPYADAGLRLLRIVYHPQWWPQIAQLVGHARQHGLQVSINMALASRYLPGELVEHATRIATTMRPDLLYVADTCGALLPDQVGSLVGYVRQNTGVSVGFHAHDFLTLGYANALAAVAAGAELLDVSVLGLGRGGGNLSGELVLLRHRLPGRWLTGPLALFLDQREQLAAVARRPLPDLVPMVCGALNLTPVEEEELRTFAAGEDLDPQLAALWLATAAGRVASLRGDGLRAAWRAETAGVAA
ncbi:hypothetical protein AB0M46_21655 [Dactylosporangium sp. NPDC051485]|uniref:hypothetical protein n=1 Tax=Dactylosporangium sp. NPDC051485 TaxID=3154846 RepID=UPI003427725E